jgi:hypothetical protein
VGPKQAAIEWLRGIDMIDTSCVYVVGPGFSLPERFLMKSKIKLNCARPDYDEGISRNRTGYKD